VIRELSDLDNLANVECIAEEMVPFKMNLPLSFVAIHLEKLKPVVEMEFHPEANQVEYVICPARIDAKVAEKLEQLLYMYRKNLIMSDFSR
jgi:5-(carboxyamino)imidazole ribonucleotide synthase